jgi:hypothetical protein
MGIFQGFLRIGLVILALFGAIGMAPSQARFSVNEEDEDSSSGRWEGIAMAGLEVPPAKNPVT